MNIATKKTASSPKLVPPMKNMNKLELKEHERKTWSAVAEGWRRQDKLLRKGSAPVTERMLDLAGIDAGHWVLDIASGTGEPAISAARRVGDTGKVIGTDLVEEMLCVAREKVLQENLNNIEFRCVDGEALEFESDSFDAITIRWGLMFMPEPEACLSRVYRLLKSNGRIVAAYWSTMKDIVGPIMVLVNQLDDKTYATFVADVIETANGLQVGETLHMRGTTWIVSGTR